MAETPCFRSAGPRERRKEASAISGSTGQWVARESSYEVFQGKRDKSVGESLGVLGNSVEP